jgi:hypothetical protein
MSPEANSNSTLARCDRHRPQGCSGATDGVVGRFRIRVWARHRGPARADDEISKLVFYERLIFFRKPDRSGTASRMIGSVKDSPG